MIKSRLLIQLRHLSYRSRFSVFRVYVRDFRSIVYFLKIVFKLIKLSWKIKRKPSRQIESMIDALKVEWAKDYPSID